jgi:hypothetical protein
MSDTADDDVFVDAVSADSYYISSVLPGLLKNEELKKHMSHEAARLITDCSKSSVKDFFAKQLVTPAVNDAVNAVIAKCENPKEKPKLGLLLKFGRSIASFMASEKANSIDTFLESQATDEDFINLIRGLKGDETADKMKSAIQDVRDNEKILIDVWKIFASDKWNLKNMANINPTDLENIKSFISNQVEKSCIETEMQKKQEKHGGRTRKTHKKRKGKRRKTKRK